MGKSQATLPVHATLFYLASPKSKLKERHNEISTGQPLICEINIHIGIPHFREIPFLLEFLEVLSYSKKHHFPFITTSFLIRENTGLLSNTTHPFVVVNKHVSQFSLKIFCLIFGEIDFRLKVKTKGKIMKLIPQKLQQKTAMI